MTPKPTLLLRARNGKEGDGGGSFSDEFSESAFDVAFLRGVFLAHRLIFVDGWLERGRANVTADEREAMVQ